MCIAFHTALFTSSFAFCHFLPCNLYFTLFAEFQDDARYRKKDSVKFVNIISTKNGTRPLLDVSVKCQQVLCVRFVATANLTGALR